MNHFAFLLRPVDSVSQPCKNGSPRVSTVEVVILECKIDDYGKIFTG